MSNGIEFKRDKETGELVAYKNGEKLGSIVTMGDSVEDKEESKKEEKNG